MADKGIKTVTLQPNNVVLITYTDGSTASKPSSAATREITAAKTSNQFVDNSNPSGGGAFGNTPNNGGTVIPAGTSYVMVNGQKMTLTAAATAANSIKELGKIRTALVDAGQLTKAQAKDKDSVLNKWSTILAGASSDPDSKNDPYIYLKNLQKAGFTNTPTTTGTAKTNAPYSQITVWDPTKAKDYITQLSTNLLNREPTQQELADLSHQLSDAQKKAALNTTYKTDPKTGKVTSTQTGGLDEQQFLTDLIKKNPDYVKVKDAATAGAIQSVNSAAKSNGIVLTPEDAAVYAERVRNGEKIDDIASTFRKIASISQPKAVADLLNAGTDLATIYQPYKAAMAKTLEVNPDTIDITDPALSNAVTGDKTMTTYEFQRALRKDPRWQYTDNARSEAADVATQVLKDFGFQG